MALIGSIPRRCVNLPPGSLRTLIGSIIGNKVQEGPETRQSMMQIMDLNVKSHALLEKRQEAEVKMTLYENEKIEKEVKIEEVSNRPFIKRLLRQK